MSMRHMMGYPREATVCACHCKQQCDSRLVVAFQRVGRVDSYVWIVSLKQSFLLVPSFPCKLWQTCQSLAVKDCIGDLVVMPIGEISFHL